MIGLVNYMKYELLYEILHVLVQPVITLYFRLAKNLVLYDRGHNIAFYWTLKYLLHIIMSEVFMPGFVINK